MNKIELNGAPGTSEINWKRGMNKPCFVGTLLLQLKNFQLSTVANWWPISIPKHLLMEMQIAESFYNSNLAYYFYQNENRELKKLKKFSDFPLVLEGNLQKCQRQTVFFKITAIFLC